MSDPRTQMLMAALSSAAQLAMSKQGQTHDQAMFALKSGALAQMTDALVTRRVEAVEHGFLQVLSGYAEQARHLMAQQAAFGAQQLSSSDPLTRVELAQRIRDVDVQLGYIRADAALLYQRMTEVILLLGGQGIRCGGDLGSALSLAPQPLGGFA